MDTISSCLCIVRYFLNDRLSSFFREIMYIVYCLNLSQPQSDEIIAYHHVQFSKTLDHQT